MNSLYINTNKLINKNNGIEWKVSKTLVAYSKAIKLMEKRVENIHKNISPEMIWLLQHPPIYTCGTSAKNIEILDSGKIPVIETTRGGKVTFHGPGQRIAYIMLDLNIRRKDIKFYVSTLEEWCIATLKEFDIKSFTVKGRTGIWIKNSSGESKIGAIGVRVSRWVTYHGISINVNPDLKAYDGIIACGLENYSTTSLRQIGIKIEMKDFDQKLIRTAKNFF